MHVSRANGKTTQVSAELRGGLGLLRGLSSEIMPPVHLPATYLMSCKWRPHQPLPDSWPGARRSPVNLFSSFKEYIYKG